MYSRCLFCHSDLGRNTLVEAFPVGRRLAYDAARGRLWVVCRKCERWNLTPLEERWEAMEVAERLYRDTRARVATEQVGLARFTDDHGRFELVRIGKPLRPEFAAWRYGDQFGRRRRRHFMYAAGAVAATGALFVAGPVTGLIGGLFSPLISLSSHVSASYDRNRLVRVPSSDDGVSLVVRRKHVSTALLGFDDGELHLRFQAVRDDHRRAKHGWTARGSIEEVVLSGDAAVRAAGALLPSLNQSGGSARRVQEAVLLLERHSRPDRIFERAARDAADRWTDTFRTTDPGELRSIPHVMRLALEMASHEETERRAMEGELALLEAAWKDAEEIAKIADAL